MASAHKATPSTPSGGGSGGRSKKPKSLIIQLKLSPSLLAKFAPAAPEVKDEATTAADDKPPASSSTSSLSDSKALTASPLAEGEATSNGNTPVPSGTDDSVAMPPPAGGEAGAGTPGGKGKGGKKRASLAVDGVVKVRGKPGPKKRKL
ncbi:hypothetical protein V498_10252, partial [Pseudogymnoascus sp. VKM F-4517 (FW-2822)]